MYENAFKNIDNAMRNDEGLASELDYAEQTAWLLFLKYLDDMEREWADEAILEGNDYEPILAAPWRWQDWAAPKDAEGKLDAEKIGQAIAEISTRLGLTGKPLQEMAVQMLNLARTAGTDIGPLIAAATRTFGDWSIATSQQSKALDYLFRTSQTTGIGVQQLMEIVVQFGAPMRALGFTFEQAAAMMGKWEKEGVNTELVIGSLRIAAGNFARDNIPLRDGLNETMEAITAIRRIAGVKDAKQYTIPKQEVIDSVRAGQNPAVPANEAHLRECFVVAEPGADLAAIETAIVTMPHYFADYETKVNFISEEEFSKNHSTIPHGGFVFRSGQTSPGVGQIIEFALKLDSNPEFTASVLSAYARATFRLAQHGFAGACTVFDIPPGWLSPKTADELRRELL